MAFHSVFSQMSELNFNDQDVFPQACTYAF